MSVNSKIEFDFHFQIFQPFDILSTFLHPLPQQLPHLPSTCLLRPLDRVVNTAARACHQIIGPVYTDSTLATTMNNNNKGWVKIQTETQGTYYHNPATNVTSWDLPPNAVLANQPTIKSIDEGVRKGYKRMSLNPPATRTPAAAAAAVAVGKRTTMAVGAKKKQAAVAHKKRATTRSHPTPNLSTLHEAAAAGGQSRKGVRSQPMYQSHRFQQLNRANSQQPEHPQQLQQQPPQQPTDPTCCQRFHTMPLSVWLLWLLPTCFFLAAGVYTWDANVKWSNEYRPSTPNNTKGAPLDMIRTGTNTESMLAYAAANVTAFNSATSLEPSCKSHFQAQVPATEAALCEGYCLMCGLGGDTQRYPELPWALAGFWSVVFVATFVLFPILKKQLCKNTKRFVWSELRTFMLLLFIVVLFSTVLFLIHQSRVIAVPQGHSMFTFWIFYSSYFFWSVLVYWLRMDLQLIKARNPELSLGGAVCGYIICTNAVGAYYLTGTQAWPCLLSMMTFYVVYPAYFLSFTRRGKCTTSLIDIHCPFCICIDEISVSFRFSLALFSSGLELWLIVSHHRKVLKKMKNEEFQELEDTDTESDEEAGEGGGSGGGGSGSGSGSGSGGGFTYDPEMEKLKVCDICSCCCYGRTFFSVLVLTTSFCCAFSSL